MPRALTPIPQPGWAANTPYACSILNPVSHILVDCQKHLKTHSLNSPYFPQTRNIVASEIMELALRV